MGHASKFTPAQVYREFMEGKSFRDLGWDMWHRPEGADMPLGDCIQFMVDQLRRYLLARDRRRKGKK
jgi:hypothetical protein